MIGRYLIAASLLAVASACTSEISDPLRIDAGLVSAGPASASGVRAFKGLPFGAPPVGDLRWRAPQPVEPWDDVRDASAFHDVCVQQQGRNWTNIALLPDGPGMSEDCLYLNVWTAAQSPSDSLPVMVFFYGGAFTDGAGSVPLYDGTALAEKGAIVVTMNYRLGAFGFFAHPQLSETSAHSVSGNYGIMDMLASLEWVQNNIAAFGGDPNNVTVFGQSAGANAIVGLAASARAQGQFQRAIAESIMGLTPAPGMRTLAQAEEAGVEAATTAGVSTAAELRAMSVEEVTANFRSAGMIVDGWAIPEDPGLVYSQGRQNAVDIMYGANKDESLFSRPTTPEQFQERARRRYGELTDAYLAVYPAATDEEAAVASAEANRDETFWRARAYAELHRQRGNDAYVFFFAQNPPASAGEAPLPASHASEVPYVFNNLGEHPLYPDQSNPELAAASAADQQLADQMSSYWVNFARSGNPNGEGLPNWPAHQSLDTVNAAILDANPASESLPSLARMQFFDRNLERIAARSE